MSIKENILYCDFNYISYTLHFCFSWIYAKKTTKDRVILQ